MLIFLTANAFILPAAALCLLPMWSHMKYGTGRTAVIMAAFFVVAIPGAALLCRRLGLGFRVAQVGLLASFFAVYALCLDTPLCKSLAVFADVCALIHILDNIACIFDSRFNPQSGAMALSPQSASIRLALIALMLGLLWVPFRRHAGRLIDRLDIPAIWYMTLPFSTMLIVISLFLRPVYYQTLYVNNVYRSFTLSVTSCLVLWCMLCVVFYFIVIGILNAGHMQEQMRILQMQERQFLSQQRYLEASSRARHDFRQSVHTMQQLYRSGDYEALGQYIDRYYDAMPVAGTRTYCDNIALNALLNHYAQLADSAGIRCDLRVESPGRKGISDPDLCAIVGNILENAVAACQGLPESDRWIRLTMRVEHGNRLYIVATNAFDGHARFVNGHYLSTRQKGGGIGLRSISATAEKYGGHVSFSHVGKEFHSDVMLPL